MSLYAQGRSQELEIGGAKLLSMGFWGRLRPPVGPGQSSGRGVKGQSPPEALGFLINKFPKIYRIIRQMSINTTRLYLLYQ